MRWFRFHAEAVHDPKLRLLAFEDRWHFVAILCLKADGLLDQGLEESMLDRQVGVIMGLTLAEAEKVRMRLEDVGLIERSWQPTGWNKRQYRSDVSTHRVREHRRRRASEENQQVAIDATVGNVPETAPETDTEAEEQICSARAERRDRRFAEFWAAWPTGRKVGKKTALDTWKRRHLDKHADAIIADVKARAERDPQWKKGVEFIPHPTTYLRAERWTDEWEGPQQIEDEWKWANRRARELGLQEFQGIARGESPEAFIARVKAAHDRKKTG